MIAQAGESSCRWPGCSQPPELSAAVCYWHGKVSRGLIETEEGTKGAEAQSEEEPVARTA